jgi:alpha-tubulin suppressor-like RCC1 family protein
MVRRFGVVGSAGVLLASAFAAVGTLGVSAAQATSFQDWATVDAGGTHTCGVRRNGKLYCWGADAAGQVGDGGDSPDEITAPVRIGTYEDWVTVSAGGGHTCGVRRNGKLYCWGSDEDGQIGNGGGYAFAITTPRRIGTFEDWVSVSAGNIHTCGVRKNAKLYCWGSDGRGQVGDGGDIPELGPTAPVRVGSFADWATVSAGYDHTCGIATDGELSCWGEGTNGRLGNGSVELEEEPAFVGPFEDWVTVSAGGTHTCGVRRNGKLYCWGSDLFGQVGDGGDYSETILTPRRIGAFLDWGTVSAGPGHTCAVRRNGKLYCWGADFYGEIGDGAELPNTIRVSSPARVGTFEDWATASVGETHSCGVRKNAKLYCWGGDDNGQVGDGNNPDPATTPRRI